MPSSHPAYTIFETPMRRWTAGPYAQVNGQRDASDACRGKRGRLGSAHMSAGWFEPAHRVNRANRKRCAWITPAQILPAFPGTEGSSSGQRMKKGKGGQEPRLVFIHKTITIPEARLVILSKKNQRTGRHIACLFCILRFKINLNCGKRSHREMEIPYGTNS